MITWQTISSRNQTLLNTHKLTNHQTMSYERVQKSPMSSYVRRCTINTNNNWHSKLQRLSSGHVEVLRHINKSASLIKRLQINQQRVMINSLKLHSLLVPYYLSQQSFKQTLLHLSFTQQHLLCLPASFPLPIFLFKFNHPILLLVFNFPLLL